MKIMPLPSSVNELLGKTRLFHGDPLSARMYDITIDLHPVTLISSPGASIRMYDNSCYHNYGYHGY